MNRKLRNGLLLFLIASGVLLAFKKNLRTGLVNIAIGSVLWMFSMAPIADALMRNLESGLHLAADPRGDVIILLGGGIYSDVTDFSGAGAPTEDMLGRIVTAVRLQRKLDRKSTRLNSSHVSLSRMPSSA